MIEILSNYHNEFLSGFLVTIGSSSIALIGALILGTLFALLQIFPYRIVNFIARVYIELFRNIPLLIITLFFYIFVSNYVHLNGFIAGTIGLTLYSSAFIAETIRAGIISLDPGQNEAARSNGLTWCQSLKFIVLPQSFKLIIPSLGNQFINIVKNSSILAFVAGFDLMYQANEVSSLTFNTFDTYIVVGIFYLLITYPLNFYMSKLESKINKSERGGQ